MITTQDLTISADERIVLETIDKARDDMIETTLAWSSQNSGSHNRPGLARMRALLKDRFSSLPGDLTEVTLSTSNQVMTDGSIDTIHYEPALELRVRPDAPLQLVLTGHYDTVFPEDSAFQTPKFTDSDIINGPGTADMKAGLMVMHQALIALEASENATNIGYTVLLSPDEEIGSPGSAARLAELGAKAHMGLTYEPALADGSLAGARKGSGNFALIVRGKAAHAGREHHLGRNAIASMAEFIIGLEALNGKREGVTFNIAKIDGGGAVNIVPELAIGRFNVRIQQTEDMAWVDNHLSQLTHQINTKDGLSAELTGHFTRPPKPMAPANQVVFDWVQQAGALLGQEIKWAPSGGVCEGNNLWASGCPNVDTLGVRGGHIHSDQEFMVVSSLVERARLSALILLKVASGEFDVKAVKTMALTQSQSQHHIMPQNTSEPLSGEPA